MSGSGRTRSSEEVADALRDGAAVVALESTLITHGLPWPVNLETARGSEQAVRAAGAVPATVAVIGNMVHVPGGGPIPGGRIQGAYHDAFTFG